jgi:hypothetical protein
MRLAIVRFHGLVDMKAVQRVRCDVLEKPRYRVAPEA